MLNPIPMTSDIPARLLPTELAEFNYEPRFPICIVVDSAEAETTQRERNRLLHAGNDADVELVRVHGASSPDALERLERWLDELGI